MTDGKIPDEDSIRILTELAERGNLWEELIGYLEKHYEHEPVLTREGKDKILTIRYRKGGKTLVTLYPKKAELVVLVILGKEEVAKAEDVKMSKKVRVTFDNAKQYHDGRWLWLRPTNEKDLDSIKALLTVKRKPKNRKSSNK